MSNPSQMVTRGGVTYEVPQPTLRADEVIHSLRIGNARYFFAERIPPASIANDALMSSQTSPVSRTWARASNTNDQRRASPGRARAVSHEELSRMWDTLDLSDRDDVRVAALFILLREGLRKNEIVHLNLGDLSNPSDLTAPLRLRVQGSRENGREGRVVTLENPAKNAILRRYLAFEHKEMQYVDAPLFWTLGRHGTCRRVRITSHALSYWVTQLQRRAGIERRLSPHAFRRAWLAEGIAQGGPSELPSEAFG
jgi:integrase